SPPPLTIGTAVISFTILHVIPSVAGSNGRLRMRNPITEHNLTGVVSLAQCPGAVRHDWTRAQVGELFALPFPDLIVRAQNVHRLHFDSCQVQISTLISIKTGGCPEDCAYCPQAARYNTGVDVHAIMPKEEEIAAAEKAKAGGASRLCMGAAWREVRDNRDFDKVIEMVKAVNEMDMEVCCTLGMLTDSQAQVWLIPV